jgi:hypothetical protein
VLLDTDSLNAVACASVAACVAVDGFGNGFVGRAGTARIGPLTVRGTRVHVPVHCRGTDATVCRITLRLTRRRQKRVVVLGSTQIALAGGRAKAVSVSLNGAGKRLLARHHALAVALTVGQSGHLIFQRALTL